MLTTFIGADGLQGASVTYLSRDGTRNAINKDRKKVRRIYGTAKAGYVQLGKIDPEHPPEVVLVAEGIENALAASPLTGFPAIAVLGAGQYESLVPPPCKQLIIAGDNDASGLGRKKAETAAAWWTSAYNRSVWIASAPTHYRLRSPKE